MALRSVSVRLFVPAVSDTTRPDPRAKTLVAVVYAVCVAAAPAHPARLATFALMLVLAASILRIPARTAFTRMLPLFGLAVTALVSVAFGAPIARTADLTVRLTLISGAAIVVLASTSPTELLAALHSFGAPRTPLTVLMLTSRYLNVLDDEARRSSRAWRSRMVGPLRWRHLVALGMVAAALVRRAIERSDRIAWAMVARGFDGRLPISPLQRIGIADAFAAAVSIAAIVGVALWP